MRKKLILLCMVVGLLLLSCCFCGVCSAEEPEKVFPITATELNRLEMNINQLATINKQQKSMLMQARFDLEELQVALANCKQELNQAQNSLQNANTLLAKYEKEEQSRRRRIKRQRNFAYTLAGCVLTGWIYREVKK